MMTPSLRADAAAFVPASSFKQPSQVSVSPRFAALSETVPTASAKINGNGSARRKKKGRKNGRKETIRSKHATETDTASSTQNRKGGSKKNASTSDTVWNRNEIRSRTKRQTVKKGRKGRPMPAHNSAGKDEVTVPVLLDGNFPLLTEPVVARHRTAASTWTASEHVFRAPPAKTPASFYEKDDGLTVLRPVRRRVAENGSETTRASLPAATVEEENEPQHSLDDCCRSTPGNMLLFEPKRKPSISKLRDRWWDLVQRHGMKVAQEQQPDGPALEEEEESAHTGDDEPIVASRAFDDNISTALFDESYAGIAQPLHEAIQRNDCDTLRRLLQNPRVYSQADTTPLANNKIACSLIMSPLQLAVHLDRPELVRLLCVATDPNVRESESQVFVPPLLMAVDRGHEECLQTLLSYSGPASLLTIRDAQGNTALHCCCRGPKESNSALQTASSTSTFNILLNYAISSSSGTTFKILSSKNDQQQTPLHVACQYGQSEIVDTILNHRQISNISILTKLFSIQDMQHQTILLSAVASGSTNIVMSLLMWRGNNYTPNRLSLQFQSALHNRATGHRNNAARKDVARKSAPCPLLWAVRSNNIEMISLLLSFNDTSSGSGYDLNNALHEAVANCSESSRTLGPVADADHEDNRVEIVGLLVDAGANPCTVLEKNTRQTTVGHSAVAIASRYHNAICLEALLDSYQRYLNRLRGNRRRDPKLQNQPDSFFGSIESTENEWKSRALRDALVTSLFYSWKGTSSVSDDRLVSSAYIDCALVLYKFGGQLALADLDRLKTSLAQDTLKPCVINTTTIPETLPIQYQTQHLRTTFPYRKEDGESDALSYLSRTMLQLPWFSSRSTCTCAWIQSLADDVYGLPEPDVVLVCREGTRLLAHQFVLSKSDKLAGAIRFALMSQRQPNDDNKAPMEKCLELTVDIPSKTCRSLLEHLYHGSITCGLPEDAVDCCQALLELLLVAEEFICRSLMQECEMRLLSSAVFFNECFCGYCRGTGRLAKTELGTRSVEITYCMPGPSFLVTAEVALDVLAVAQHVVDSCSGSDYRLRVAQPNDSGGSLLLYERKPGNALFEVALLSVLRDFDAVAKSKTFTSHFESETSGKNAQAVVLEMCLGHMYELNDKLV